MSALGHVGQFYFPTNAAKGASLWGTTVYALAYAAGAADTTTTLTVASGTSTPAIIVKPYANSNTIDGSTRDLWGFGILPADMNSVAGATRYMPAGNHTATITVSSSQTAGNNVTPVMYVYQVSSAATGRARTLIAYSGGAQINGTLANANATGSVTVPCPRIDLGPDETLEYALQLLVAQNVLSSTTITLTLGSTSLTTPALGTVYTAALSESPGAPSDALKRTVVAPRALTETNSVSDAITRVATYNRALADTITSPSDALARAVVARRALTDTTASPSDALNRLVTFYRPLTEANSVADALTRLAVYNRRLADSPPAVSDNIVRGVIYARVLAENIGPTGGGTVVNNYFRTLFVFDD